MKNGYTAIHSGTFCTTGELTEGGSSPSKLHYVKLDILSNGECEKSYGSGNITDNMMCAKGANGEDACQGDSGGENGYIRTFC